jgi:hypothetical protein
VHSLVKNVFKIPRLFLMGEREGFSKQISEEHTWIQTEENYRKIEKIKDLKFFTILLS